MPSLNFEVPKSDWAKLEEYAKREGCSVRTLVLWKLKGEFGSAVSAPEVNLKPAPQAEAA